jgi:hypothetical protein
MQVSLSTLLLGFVVVAAGAFALGRETSPEAAPIVASQPEVAPRQGPDLDQGEPAEDDPHENPHAGLGGKPDLAADTEPAAVQWSVPSGWRTLPNPSSMRIATYAVPRYAGDPEEADVSVTRAGGDVSSNVERWAQQFEGAGEPKLRSQTVHGLEVTVVEIEGAYASAMHPETPRPGWALLGAIVKTRGQPYFFKMTGPAATVRAARAGFSSLIESLRSTD